MRTVSILLLSLFALVTFACEEPESDANPQTESTPMSFTSHSSGDTKMFPVMDPNTGMVSAYVPLPEDWAVSTENWKGPGGIVVELRPGYSQRGQNTGRAPSIDQMIQQHLLPSLRQHNIRVDRMYDLSNVAEKDRKTQAGFWKAAPSQDDFYAKGIEATNLQDGSKGLLVYHYSVMHTQFGYTVMDYFHMLSAPAQSIETGKKVLINALLGTQTNPQWLAAHNQREQGRIGKMNEFYRNRREDNERSFQARQKAYLETQEQINSMSQEMYQNRSDMMDRVSGRASDAMREETPYVNPYSGQTVHVPQGYQFYFVNAFGEVMGTNDQFYNPAQDPSVNSQEWRRMTQQPY